MSGAMRRWVARAAVAAVLAASLGAACVAGAATSIRVTVGSTTRTLTVAQVKAAGAKTGTYRGVPYVGAPLSKVLAKAGFNPSKVTYFRAVGSDGRVVVLTPSVMRSSTTILAYRRKSGALAASEGPFRLIVAGSKQSQNARKVTKLQANPYELDVSAASSLTDVLKDTHSDFETRYNARVVFNFNSSGAIQKQVEAGAPIDVFASAAPKQINTLIAENRIASGTEAVFASNDLTILVPAGNPAGINSPSDLTKAAKIVTGDPSLAPHGAAAKEWLSGIGMWSPLQSRLVLAPNASVTDAYLSSGVVDAGIGFKSDAHGRRDISVVYTVPLSEYTNIKYVAAPVSGATHARLASAYTAWLNSSYFQTQLVAHGFKKRP